ncbi:MAG: hypothetical protein AAGA20_05715 [Planctomycetota bacterium]
MLHLTLAITAIAAPVPPAPQDVLSVRMLQGDTLPTGDTIREIERLSPNVGAAGYAVVLTVDPGGRSEIWADFVDDGTSTPQRLYQYQLAPFNDVNFWGFQVAQGRVVWEMVQNGPGAAGQRGIYVDGSLLIEPADLSPIPGYRWGAVPSTWPTTSGTLIHYGDVYPANGDPGSMRVVIEDGSTTPRIRTGVTIPGTSALITSIGSVAISPSGNHVLARVRTLDSSFRLLLDGEPVELYGQPIRSSQFLDPQALAALNAPNAWVMNTGFWYLDVNDNGDWSASLPLFVVGRPQETWVVRNERFVAGSTDPVRALSITEDAVPLFTQDGAVQTGFGDFVRPDPMIDVDGDGTPDPGWTSLPVSIITEENGSGEIFSLAYLNAPGGASLSSVAALPRRLPFRPICSGAQNGAFLDGRFYAVGEEDVAKNELAIVAHGLPLSASGYALASLSPSAPVEPPGSVGELCLGGAIGRYAGSVFFTGLLGAGATTIDLNALPQPTGSVVGIPGQTWFFQAWYRDSIGGTPTSNFTDAIGVTLR